MAPSFLAVNGNKRSLTLDLRQPAAVEIVKRLVPGVDVVCENFRPGVMDRLGLGYPALSAINPRLIYCAVSGFGQAGPDRDHGGLRREAPGHVGDHVPHRGAGHRPDARGLRPVRHHRRGHGGPGGGQRALPADPHRPGAAGRRGHAGRGPRPSSPDRSPSTPWPVSRHRADGQRVGDPQAHRPPVPGPGRVPGPGGADRAAVREPAPGAGARRRPPGSAVPGLGRPAASTRPRCGRSSRAPWPPTTPGGLGGSPHGPRRALRRHLVDRRGGGPPPALAPRRAPDHRDSATGPCAWSAPDSGWPTAARAWTGSRPGSASTATRS